MSTRSNVIIKQDGKFKSQYYHHCDGYPSGVGNDLHRILCELFERGKLDCDSFRKNLEGSYEYEDVDYPSPHGDIEFLYTIDFISTGVILTTEDSRGNLLINTNFNI